MTAEAGLGERASQLTPREWRVVALVLEGVGSQEACDALGIASGTLESHKQAIRRKLAIPRGERLERFLQSHIAELPLPKPRASRVQTVSPEHAERRIRWLLRITLQELSEVGASAGLRAQLLSQTVRRMGTDDPAEAEREIRELEDVAREVGETYRRLIERVRGTRVSSEDS